MKKRTSEFRGERRPDRARATTRSRVFATSCVAPLVIALALTLQGWAGGDNGEAERGSDLEDAGGAAVASDNPTATSGGTSVASGAAAAASNDADVVDRESGEMTEYEGIPLNTFFREYDNSIEGPQSVDLDAYRLDVAGLVENPLSMTYNEVLKHEWQTRLVTLFCVEGWQERLVFEGVRVADILSVARPTAGVTTIIFHAVDGYTTSLPYEDVERLDLMLAAKINGLELDEMRGMPFQLVAQSKQGYKWIKWLTKIELSSEPYAGFWEVRGYSNEAEVQSSRIERERDLIEKRQPSTPTPD